MTQSTIEPQSGARPSTETAKLSLQKRSLVISLVAIIVTAAYYFTQVFELLKSNDTWQLGTALPAGYGKIAIGAIILIIAVEVVLHILLAAGAKLSPAPGQHDIDVAVKAKSNAYGIMAVGVILTVGSLFVLPSPFVMGNLLLFFFVFAEVTRYASQLFLSD